MSKTTPASVPLAFAMILIASALLALAPPPDRVLAGRQEEGLSACPPEYALGGMDAGGDRLWCRYLGVPPAGSQLVRSPGPRAGRRFVLLCPAGWYMRGLRADRAAILCSHSPGARPADEISSEGQRRLDGLRACPDDEAAIGRIRVMTGIEEDGRQLYCGAVDRPGERSSLDGPQSMVTLARGFHASCLFRCAEDVRKPGPEPERSLTLVANL